MPAECVPLKEIWIRSFKFRVVQSLYHLHPKATRLHIAKSVIQGWWMFAFTARDFNMEFLHTVFQILFVTCEVSANCILEKWQLLLHHLYLLKKSKRTVKAIYLLLDRLITFFIWENFITHMSTFDSILPRTNLTLLTTHCFATEDIHVKAISVTILNFKEKVASGSKPGHFALSRANAWDFCFAK